MSIEQIRGLTLYQLRLVTEGYETSERKSRYRRMGDKARETAARVAAKHGTF